MEEHRNFTHSTHEPKKEPHVEHHKKEQDPWKSPKKGKESSQFMKWAVTLQIILLVFIALKVNGLGGVAAVVAGDNPTPVVAPTAPEPANVDMAKLLDDDAVNGDKDAPVTIVEFSDYECPFCARFFDQTYSQIKEKYIDTGKVKLIFRDFPLSFHTQAQKAAEAAECAGEQGKYYDMHDKLFAEGVAGGVASFKGYAKSLGLDTAKFDSCLDNGDMASEVQKDFLDGQQAGVQGTPGFFVNGVPISGAQPFSVFEQVIEAALSS
jgi:protein-disulfide isomerase